MIRGGKGGGAVLAAVLLALVSGGSLSAQEREALQVDEARVVFQEITAIPEKTVPEFLLRDAHGIAIIPRVLKIGIVVGGEYGEGVVVLRDQEQGWGNPLFVRLSGGSIGWQIGAQSSDVVLVFKTPESVEGLLRGKFTIGVDAAAAAGPVGRRARASTDVELRAEIFSYSRSKGFFAGLSLDGAVLQIDDEANAAYYGRQYVSPTEIRDGSVQLPPTARELRRVLEEYTRSLPPGKTKL
ncbi:MAG: lipid-binding SYLF domain-containing protein [Spirochaetales bacterium]|nr:lipid-binding SYLF domain-containing protein [Spirochaetales bacterium]